MYSTSALLQNWNKFVMTLLSKKNPARELIDKPFIEQYKQSGVFDCTAWNYVWNAYVHFATLRPLDIFTKNHALHFRKNVKPNISAFIKLTHQKFLMNDDVNKNTYHYVQLSPSNLPVKFAKYSLPFMQNHEYELGKWLVSNSMTKRIQVLYNENAFTQSKSHSRAFDDKRNDYIYNYIMQFALYNPKQLFNKSGLFKLNRTKKTLENVFDTAYYDFNDGNYDKSLLDKYINFTNPNHSHDNQIGSAHFKFMANGIGVKMTLQALIAKRNYIASHLDDFTARSAETALNKLIHQCNAHLFYALKNFYIYGLTYNQSAKKALVSYNKMISELKNHSQKIIKDTYIDEKANRESGLDLRRTPIL